MITLTKIVNIKYNVDVLGQIFYHLFNSMEGEMGAYGIAVLSFFQALFR